jgi:hypothetical protein
MRRITARLAIACVCAVAAAAISSAAFAGNGNGNGHGSDQRSDATAQQQGGGAGGSGATQDTGPAPAGDDHVSKHDAHGPSWKQSTSSDTQQAGVKPSSTTTHWTKTTVGAKPDVSKRYGNGKTAAEIAKSRGAPDDTVLTGPGNSQPHKVSVCGKPSNKSGGVDVHAVKSYDLLKCGERSKPHGTAPVCGKEMHASKPGLSSCATKKEEVPAAVTAASPAPAPTVTETMATASQTVTVTMTTSAPAQTVTVTTPGPTETVTTTVAASEQSRASNAAPVGGVLGVQANVPKRSASGGALGAVSNVAGSTLPFTGFPLWIAVLVALGLIAAGALIRRRAAQV